jgi:hypothetical protein
LQTFWLVFAAVLPSRSSVSPSWAPNFVLTHKFNFGLHSYYLVQYPRSYTLYTTSHDWERDIVW